MISDYLVNLEDIMAKLQTEPPQRADSQASDLQPGLSAMMRCPLPPVSVTPDTTRQFYRGGMLPQIRVMSPPPNNSTGGTGSNTVTGVTNSSSTTTVGLKVQQTGVTTPILNPNNSFSGVIQIGRVFSLLQVSASNTARIRVYGTQNALNLDLARAIDVAPPFGTEQGLILDVVLDTQPLLFPLENIGGSNYDNPQTNLAYIAITNVGSATTAITVTIAYVSVVI